jgi:hypothetical protein
MKSQAPGPSQRHGPEDPPLQLAETTEHKRRGNLCGAAVSNEVRTRATPHIPASAAPVGCQQSAPRNIYPANGNCKSELEVGYEPGGSWCA